MSTENPDLSLSEVCRIDDACVRFDNALKAGEEPSIGDCLDGFTGEARAELERALAAIELEYKLKCGLTAEPTAAVASAVAERQPRWPEVPGYQILAEFPGGGMGIVYKAKQEKLKRIVALKVIRAGNLASAEQMRRFQTETQAVGQLHEHSNIVQIYEVGEHNGLPYFAMEYVDGTNLSEHLKNSPPSDMEAARLAELLARTIHFAHGQGVVHRDLKPANILLRRDRLSGVLVPKIADFGLAKFVDEEHTATASGVILGTAPYMPPEQARAGEIGPSADVYGLGAILYEMLTGLPPFRGKSFEDTVRLVANEPPVAPHVHNRRVDWAIEAICLKCLEKEPRDRYASAEKLAEDLAAFSRGEHPPGITGTATRIIAAVTRETRYTEVMTRWSGIWMGLAVMYLAICTAKSALLWTGMASHGTYSVIWLSMFCVTAALMWFCRLREGPGLSLVERQIIQIWSFFWVGFFVIVLQFYLLDAPIAGLPPILIIELGVCTASMAALLGGSFYVMAAACLITASLEMISPQIGTLISGVACAPALFWIGWKYRRLPLAA